MADKIDNLVASGLLTEEQARLLREHDPAAIPAPAAPEFSAAIPAATPPLRQEAAGGEAEEAVGETEELASAPPRKVQIPFSWRGERDLEAIERWEDAEGWPAFICRRPDETPEETERAEAQAAAFKGTNWENTFGELWYDAVEGALANAERKRERRRENKKAELEMLVRRYRSKKKKKTERAEGEQSDPDYEAPGEPDSSGSEGPPPPEYGDEWAMEKEPGSETEGAITRRVDPEAVGLKQLIEDAERELQSRGVKVFVAGSQRYVPGVSEKIWGEIKGPLEERGVFLTEDKGKRLVLNHKR